ncbi:unnamed protein product [Thelazia callipaeda]|uniref:Ovule protein n=1 Tax=Thelazia callipaeda TaxID=103827 RepID=A0A0N5CQQ8_THECL|nr:unnamed protein product [Thelazia callipaeda]
MKCYEFIKRTAHTGFSLSTIRQLSPPLQSVATNHTTNTPHTTTPSLATAMRHLQPLKHTDRQQIPSTPVFIDLMNFQSLT